MLIKSSTGSEFPVDDDKVSNLRDGCDDPGEKIQKEQRRDGMYPCEYCIDPYNTEDTGSHNDNDRWDDGFAEPA